jgi:hypothetical protein
MLERITLHVAALLEKLSLFLAAILERPALLLAAMLKKRQDPLVAIGLAHLANAI